MPLLFGRVYQIEVDGLGVEGLRCGFTIEKDLTKNPNTCECVVYNLARDTRERLHRATSVPVSISAGYADTGLALLFRGNLRESFSRPESDGSWATVLRAGDGDVARKKRSKKGMRPGVSLERVIGDMARDLGIGIGNAGAEVIRQIKSSDFSADGLGRAFTSGLTASGSTAAQFDKLMASTGNAWSVQDGEIQVIPKGRVLGVSAVVLNSSSGLEGSPTVDEHGVLHFRCRIIPGLQPGAPVIVESFEQGGRVLKGGRRVPATGTWQITKMRCIGDTHGQDWGFDCEGREVK